MRALITTIASIALIAPASFAGIPDIGQVNAEVARTDASILAWASGTSDFERGPQDYQVPGSPNAGFGSSSDPLGSSGSPFSLGDGGSITFTFDGLIQNGAGPDFAVFENAFEFGGNVFGELGFVEVSSDGFVFSRVPALARDATATGSFDPTDSDDYYNIAGAFLGGTGIDLDDLVLAADPNVLSGDLDLTAITHVRIVDVVGDVAGPGATVDCLGRVVSDPYPTDFASGGMDITGVGVIHFAPPTGTESTSWSEVKALFR